MPFFMRMEWRFFPGYCTSASGFHPEARLRAVFYPRSGGIGNSPAPENRAGLLMQSACSGMISRRDGCLKSRRRERPQRGRLLRAALSAAGVSVAVVSSVSVAVGVVGRRFRRVVGIFHIRIDIGISGRRSGGRFAGRGCRSGFLGRNDYFDGGRRRDGGGQAVSLAGADAQSVGIGQVLQDGVARAGALSVVLTSMLKWLLTEILRASLPLRKGMMPARLPSLSVQMAQKERSTWTKYCGRM